MAVGGGGWVVSGHRADGSATVGTRTSGGGAPPLKELLHTSHRTWPRWALADGGLAGEHTPSRAGGAPPPPYATGGQIRMSMGTRRSAVGQTRTRTGGCGWVAPCLSRLSSAAGGAARLAVWPVVTLRQRLGPARAQRRRRRPPSLPPCRAAPDVAVTDGRRVAPHGPSSRGSTPVGSTHTQNGSFLPSFQRACPTSVRANEGGCTARRGGRAGGGGGVHSNDNL